MKHGTPSAYEEGCRCNDCKKANAKRKRKYVHKAPFILDALAKAIYKHGTAWMEKAVCKNYDPELWYSEEKPERDRAKALCHTCPMETKCYIYAMDAREPHGIWGGLDPKERRDRVKEGRVYVEDIVERVGWLDDLLDHARQRREESG